MIPNKKEKFLSDSKKKFYLEIKNFQKNFKPTNQIEGVASYVFIGDKNYPNVNLFNISNDKKEAYFKNSSEIVKNSYNDIFKIKARNILGDTKPTSIKNISTRINDEIRNVYKAKNMVNFSSKFEKEISFNKIIFNKEAGNLGSKNELVSLDVQENTKTDNSIEKYTSQDLKAKNSIIALYEKGVNEHQIINLISLGAFGVSSNKKLVPTKWAISLYDKTIEEYLYKKIFNFKQINFFEVYTFEDKGNFFLLILFPQHFSANIIEIFGETFLEDYVSYDNKLNKKKPDTSGGYYATKISCLEFLLKRKKQAGVLSIRLIKDYDFPLGVVFVRESVREAFLKLVFKTSSFEELEKYILINKKKYYYYFKKAKILLERKVNKKLLDFY